MLFDGQLIKQYRCETESSCQLARVAFRELQVRTVSLVDEVDFLVFDLGDLLVDKMQYVVLVLVWQAFRCEFAWRWPFWLWRFWICSQCPNLYVYPLVCLRRLDETFLIFGVGQVRLDQVGVV